MIVHSVRTYVWPTRLLYVDRDLRAVSLHLRFARRQLRREVDVLLVALRPGGGAGREQAVDAARRRPRRRQLVGPTVGHSSHLGRAQRLAQAPLVRFRCGDVSGGAGGRGAARGGGGGGGEGGGEGEVVLATALRDEVGESLSQGREGGSGGGEGPPALRH